MNEPDIISEKLLHYIWQFQRFNTQNLKTDEGQNIQIVQIGNINSNAGPDFQEGKLYIDEILWAGNIELHIKSSEWYAHNHQLNVDYDNVILHVVWKNDKIIYRKNGQPIPTLSLNNRVDSKLLSDYQVLMTSPTPIPCYSQFEKTNSITKILMLEKVLITRLERKAELVITSLTENIGNWEETTYQILAKTMGFGLNSIPFERLAKLVPLKILQKQNNIISIEALLFGVAGFLEEPKDEYSFKLQKEYRFLKSKYSINHTIGLHEWKFMRLRPANFPSLRIAQFSQIIENTKNLFSYFMMFNNMAMIHNMFKTKPTTYWETRYNFGANNTEKHLGIGKGSIENILINAVVPILAAYSITKNEQEYIEKAMNLLENLPAENNKITRFWNTLQNETKSAFDSQACIELYNEFCLKKNCLNCNIGISILKN